MRPAWDDDIAILSGENVSFSIETAGLGSRLAASGIDILLQMVLLYIVAMAFNIISEGLGTAGAWITAVNKGLLNILIFIVLWGYYFLFEWLCNGQTPGKRMLGLRVVEVSGLPITLWDSFLRNTMRVIDFLPVFYGVGGLTGMLNPHNRRLGDLAAGTVVARERREAGSRLLSVNQAADAFLEALTSPTAAPAANTALTGNAPAPTSRLTHEDWELLTGFLRRRGEMMPTPRARLARELTLRMSVRLGEAPPYGREEAFLEYVARVTGPQG